MDITNLIDIFDVLLVSISLCFILYLLNKITLIKNKNIFQEYILVILVILTVIGIIVWIYVLINKFNRVL
ncbi:hypothetical protein D3C81_1632170 [compost metagenome]